MEDINGVSPFLVNSPCFTADLEYGKGSCNIGIILISFFLVYGILQFLDMSSLQTALPNAQLPSTYLGGVSQPWFPQNPVTPCIPGTPQGSVYFLLGT